MSKYWSSKSRTRSVQSKCYFHHIFSCLSTHFMLYYAYQTSFHWILTVSIVWGFYRWNCNYKTLYKKRACHYGVNNCGLSSRLLNSCNSETWISPTTCTHYWNISLWQHMSRGIKSSFRFPIHVVPSRLCIMCISQICTPNLIPTLWR